ncbi:HlyD family secretion protein [Methylocella sp.]|uniref:HlyD family secretion protein n=1 Tax=Methylocella sp. TaxID=1978226 RepID=UPI0037847356
MRNKRLFRKVLAFGLAALAAGAFSVAYRMRPGGAAPPRSLGVARETEIRIAPDTTGRLGRVLVEAGRRVSKGEVLAILSNPELEASVAEAKAAAANARAERDNVYAGVRKEQVEIAAEGVRIAEANLTLAQQQFARSDELVRKNFTTQQKYDEGAAELKKAEADLVFRKAVYARAAAGATAEERSSAEAKVALAEATVADLAARLRKTVLVAPVDGVVRSLVVTPGEVVSSGEPVMTLEAGHERWFTFTLREDALRGLSIGSSLRLRDAHGVAIETKVSELRPLGEFAVWRAARAVGDHDLNSFFLRADPVSYVEGIEPGMTVWIDERGSRAP